jgi:flagellar protein FlbD
VLDMIALTRLNNKLLVVNCDLIKFLENTPDTVLTLISGEKVVVRETVEEIISRIVDYRRRLGTITTLLPRPQTPLPPDESAGGPE